MQQSRRFFIKLMKLFLTGGRAIHTRSKLFYDFLGHGKKINFSANAAGQRLGLTALTKTSKNDDTKKQARLRVACVVLERCAPLKTTAASRRLKKVEMCAVREWHIIEVFRHRPNLSTCRCSISSRCQYFENCTT